MVFENQPSKLVLKGPQLPAQLSVFAPSGPLVPDYSPGAIAAWLAQHTGREVPDLAFDGMSSGNDALNFRYVAGGSGGADTFRVDVAGLQAWAALHIVREVPGANVGADVLGYYFQNPSFPQQLQRRIVNEVVRADYQAVGFNPGTSDIAALDYAMGQINASFGRPDPLVIEVCNRLYFSVTSQCAMELVQNGVFANVNGATIFEVRYAGSAIVDVAVGLQLDPTGQIDVDALAVGTVNILPPAGAAPGDYLEMGSKVFMVSDTVGAFGEELMVYATRDLNSGPEPTSSTVMAPMRSPAGEPLIGSAPGALRPGRVKNLCARDPESHDAARSFGVPAPDQLGYPSGPVLSVEVKSPVGPTPTDAFTVNGVVAGPAMAGRTCLLAVKHQGLYFFHGLGSWPANADHLSFQVSLDYKWSNLLGTTENNYELMVVVLPSGSGTDETFVPSTSVKLRRRP
jgi:hypothetical protein